LARRGLVNLGWRRCVGRARGYSIRLVLNELA